MKYLYSALLTGYVFIGSVFILSLMMIYFPLKLTSNVISDIMFAVQTGIEELVIDILIQMNQFKHYIEKKAEE